MHLLDRIDKALADKAKTVDHADFERFALDRLGSSYPTLAPIFGGSDFGRDGDIFDPDGGPPIRLVATTSRGLEGVRKNLHSGLKSLARHEQVVERVVLVNLAQLSATNRASLEKSAAAYKVSILANYDRQWVAHQLRADGEWRRRLLGIPGGPVGVSRLPPELADTPWVRLPLIGREGELEDLQSGGTQDVIVSGPPGCGKSRLLSELEGVVFVEHDVATDVVIDDLRMLQPSTVVIDDAVDRVSLLRQIALARRQEPDLLTFRLLAVCWPDEVEVLRDDLRTAQHIELELLEQVHVDQIIQTMGIQGQLPRHEILKQAEGRPGWAVALGDLLVSSRDATDLLSGRALRGEVHRYLRRRKLGDAADVLTAIAVLGQVVDDDLDDLAHQLSLGRGDLVDLLTGAARSGLIDVTRSWGSGQVQRSYRVRPPMLAYALVAERVFEAPAFNLVRMFECWPGHRAAITAAAVEAARLGVEDARPVAGRLYELTMEEMTVRSAGGAELARSFGLLDRDAAEHVVDQLAISFASTLGSGHSNMAYALSPFVSVARDLAPWKLPKASHLLLDAALADHRGTQSSFPNHPLREIAELITKFHPELPTTSGMSVFLAETAGAWLGDDPDEARWMAWAHVVAATINPRRSGAFSEPGQPMSVSFFETVAGIEESIEVVDGAWPFVVGPLSEAPSSALLPVIGSVELWLRIGAGLDQPFGKEHPAELVENAAQVGRKLLGELVPHVQGHPGVSARVREIAKRHLVDSDITVPLPFDAFVVEPTLAGDWRRDPRATINRVQSIIAEWHREVPTVVVGRLIEIRRELEFTGQRWSTVRIACEAISQRVGDTAPWLDASLDLVLFPEAEPFVTAHRQRHGALADDLIDRAMAEPRARSAVVRAVLTDVDASTGEVLSVVERLGESDVLLLEELNQIDGLRDRVRRILVEATPTVRSAMALAMTAELVVHEDWAPGDLESEWLAALDQVAECASIAQTQDHLFRFLARRYPLRLIELLRAALPANDDDIWSGQGPPQAMFDALSEMPSDSKVVVLQSELGQVGREKVLDGILSKDVEWLSEAIDGGALTADEVVNHIGRLEPKPPLEDIARIVVPRGVEPDRVVYLASNGSWVGDKSNWYQSSADMFARMAESEEAVVADVGRRGQVYFTGLADEARREEKRQRILGYR